MSSQVRSALLLPVAVGVAYDTRLQKRKKKKGVRRGKEKVKYTKGKKEKHCWRLTVTQTTRPTKSLQFSTAHIH
jgi:hypothetical protein